MNIQICINTLRISEVDTGSAVAIGTNYFFGWRNHSKFNSGFGRLSGDQCKLPNSYFKLDDQDIQDMFSHIQLPREY